MTFSTSMFWCCGIVRSLVEAVANNCPNAFIQIISNTENSIVPIASEVLKQKSVYDPKNLFGVITLDVYRENTFVAQKKNLRLIDVPVVEVMLGSPFFHYCPKQSLPKDSEGD